MHFLFVLFKSLSNVQLYFKLEWNLKKKKNFKLGFLQYCLTIVLHFVQKAIILWRITYPLISNDISNEEDYIYVAHNFLC